ncbi:MAG: CDP-alcohol phosphatidyltransferase family protein [Candidatus Bathyarchaeia archaeon]
MLIRIKRYLQGILDAGALHLVRLGVTPNLTSVFGLAASLVAAFFYLNMSYFPLLVWLGGLALFASGMFDALDGAMARLSNRSTPFGSFLDSLLDRYADAAIIFGISLGTPRDTTLLGLNILAWGFIAMFGSITVSYLRAKAESLGISLSGVGLAERPERVAILIVSSMFLRPDIGVVAVALLANVTVAERSLHVYKKLKAK